MNYNIHPMEGINRIIGVYHADGGIIGELKYFSGKIFGNSHCSLCDVTSGKNKKNWNKCQQDLGIDVDMVHLNERKEDLAKFTKGITPCIVGQTSTNYVLIVSNKELDNCNGNTEELEKILHKKLAI